MYVLEVLIWASFPENLLTNKKPISPADEQLPQPDQALGLYFELHPPI